MRTVARRQTGTLHEDTRLMKRQFEITFAFGMTLDQEDVEGVRNSSDPDSDLKEEAAAIRFLLALHWSRFVLKTLEGGREKEILKQVTLGLTGWVEDHMRFDEMPDRTKSDLPAGDTQEGSTDAPQKRQFDVTLAHRVDLDQKDLDELKSENLEEHTDDWVLRYSLAQDWSSGLADKIEPPLDSNAFSTVYELLLNRAYDDMDIEETTDPEVLRLIDPLGAVRLRAQRDKEWEAGAEKRAQEAEAIRLANSARIVDGKVHCPRCDRVFAAEIVSSWKGEQDWAICKPDGCNRSFDLPRRLAVCSCGRWQSVPKGKEHGICECGGLVEINEKTA